MWRLAYGSRILESIVDRTESLILASLSTISMSHMQDVILEKTFSLFNK